MIPLSVVLGAWIILCAGLQPNIFVGCRVWVPGDESEFRFVDARALTAEEAELPDRRINGALMYQLLHPVQNRFPLRPIGLPRLLVEQLVDVWPGFNSVFQNIVLCQRVLDMR